MNNRKAVVLLLLITLSWGAAFLFMKMGLQELEPYNVLFLRFTVAFVAALPMLIRQRRHFNRVALRDGVVLGLILTALFIFLLNGLKQTTSANAGFLTSLTVVYVPLILAVKTRSMPTRPVLAGMLLFLCGIGLMTLGQGFNGANVGDGLCAIGSFFYAVQICYTNYAIKRSDPMLIGVLQLGTTAVFGLILTLIFETPALPSTPSGIFAILMLGIFCSAFGFAMQPVAQRHSTPTQTGFIFALEPVFSAILGVLILHERLSASAVAGIVLAFAGMVVSNLKAVPEKAGTDANSKM